MHQNATAVAVDRVVLVASGETSAEANAASGKSRDTIAKKAYVVPGRFDTKFG
jgi:hypothetical protein